METNKFSISKDTISILAVSIFVPAFLSMIGFGIYHGSFHVNANNTHCHENVCHNH